MFTCGGHRSARSAAGWNRESAKHISFHSSSGILHAILISFQFLRVRVSIRVRVRVRDRVRDRDRVRAR